PLSPVLRQPAPDAHDGTGGAQYGEQRRARRQAGQRVPAGPGGLVELGPLVGEGGGQVPVDLVEALAGRALAADDHVQGLLVVAVLVLLAGGAVTLLPLPHAGEGGRDGPGAVVVVREALGVREALAEAVDLPADGVVVGAAGCLAGPPGLGGAGHQREVLVAAGLQGGDPGVVQHLQRTHAVVAGVVQSGAGQGVAGGQPQQDHRGGRRGRHQAVVEEAVGAPVGAVLRPGEGGQGDDAEGDRRPGVRGGVRVVGAQPLVLRAVQVLRGGEHLLLHLLVRVPQVGAAHGEALPVVRAGALHQALVLRQQAVEVGDGGGGGGGGLGVGRRLDQLGGGGADVPLVAVAGLLRLLPAGQEAAGGGGVGGGERAVDVGGVRAEGLAAVQHVVGGGRPVGHLPGGDGAEGEDEGGQHGADDAQPAGLGGGGPARSEERRVGKECRVRG